MRYEYEDPLEKGYKKVKISKSQHLKLFPRHPIRKFCKCEYYVRDSDILILNLTTTLGKILATLLFPLSVMIHGFGNFRQIIGDYRRLYQEKRTGSFSSDTIWSSSDKYQEFLDVLKENT